MALVPKKGMISTMQQLPVITGDEFFEVIQVDQQGTFRNFKVLLSDVRVNTGLSAYEVALSKGFEGTVEEWLETLKGKSVYQIAVDAGFEGTEEEFLVTLKGVDGADGQSAFALAVAEGYEGDTLEWLASLKGTNGQSAFELAVELGYEGTVEEWLVSIKGTDGVDGVDGQSAFELAVEAGYAGTKEDLSQALNRLDQEASPAISGAIFVRNVTPLNPADNVGNKVYANDAKTLISCSSTTNSVTVQLDAVTGYSSYKPEVTYEGRPVNLTVSPTNELIWKGQITVSDLEFDGSGSAILKFIHNDGAVGRVGITTDVAPAISRAEFTSAYPGTQTELKENDKVNISFDVDSDVVAYEIRDTGALKAASGTLTVGTTHVVTGLSVANRGVELQSLPFEIRVRKAGGAWSEWYQSNLAGTEELVNVVNVNNLAPSIVLGAITYPAGQSAIKVGDEATVNFTLANYSGSVVVTPIGNSIELVSVDDATAVVKTAAGATNSSADNVSISLTREANGSTATVRAAVVVSTQAPTIAITLPAARLRSGGNFGTEVQKHTVTLTASEALTGAPTLVAPEGEWEAAAWVSNGNGKVWTRKLLVSDDNAKGTFTFTGLSAMSTSGLEATTITSGASYVLGGFVIRILTVAAWQNRTTAIGTMVANTAKLRCSNLSKGQQGSLNATYKADDADEINKYTIKDGNTWYNCDMMNAVSNTQGAAKVEIEEVV